MTRLIKAAVRRILLWIRRAPAPDTRCLRCGGSTVEPTDAAWPCWDCAGSGTDSTELVDTYRGEP